MSIMYTYIYSYISLCSNVYLHDVAFEGELTQMYIPNPSNGDESRNMDLRLANVIVFKMVGDPQGDQVILELPSYDDCHSEQVRMYVYTYVYT